MSKQTIISVREFPDFKDCREVLDRFLTDAGIENPFVHPDWLSVWWTFYGEGKRLQILLFYDSCKVVGYAPLFYKRLPVLGIRFYYFAGHRTANYLDLCARKGWEEAVGDAFFRHLKRQKASAVFRLNDVNTDAPCYPVLQGWAEGLRGCAFLLYSCPQCRLDEEWETFFRKSFRKSKRRTELRKFATRLESMGHLEFKVIETVDLFNAYLPRLEQIHQARFGKTLNRFLEGRERDFLRELGCRWIGERLHLSVLELDGQVISYLIGYYAGKTFIDVAPGFDPALGKFNLGHVHIMKLIQWLIPRGIRLFDLSKGDAVYKRKWADHQTANYYFLFLLNASFISSLVYCLQCGKAAFTRWLRKAGYYSALKAVLGRIRAHMTDDDAGPAKSRVQKVVIEEADSAGGAKPMTYSAISTLGPALRKAIVEYHYAHPDDRLWMTAKDEDRVALLNESDGTAIFLSMVER